MGGSATQLKIKIKKKLKEISVQFQSQDSMATANGTKPSLTFILFLDSQMCLTDFSLHVLKIFNLEHAQSLRSLVNVH